MQGGEENKISKTKVTSSVYFCLFLFIWEPYNVPLNAVLSGKALNQKGEKYEDTEFK